MTTTTPDQLQWLQSLQSFLNTLLMPILPKDEVRYKYLGPAQMSIWETAFTHETVSPSNNYEDLEYLGDMVLKYVFPKYMMARMPHLSKSEYTELNVAYMSKMYQARLAQEMGLPQYVRVQGLDRVILNIEADAFESFFGALDKVTDTVVMGLGVNNCYKMITHLFTGREIDESKGRGSSKTQVIQMFVRFELPKPRDVVEDDGNGRSTVFKVELTDEHLEFLRKYGLNIRDRTIGYAVGATKKEAEVEAYNSALRKLASYGITTKWAEDARLNIDLSDPNVAPYVPQARKRLAKEGFVRMYYFIPRKTVTATGAVVQLVGVRANGSQEVLVYVYAHDRTIGYRESKGHLMQTYAAGVL
jgi:dsRNA-specific ribonuclease